MNKKYFRKSKLHNAIINRRTVLMLGTASLLSIINSQPALSETINHTGPITIATSNNGSNGATSELTTPIPQGGNGTDAYEITPTPGTSPDHNEVTIDNNVMIIGGNGGTGNFAGNAGNGISGSGLTITNNSGSKITGGNGGAALQTRGGYGGHGINGDDLIIDNNGEIRGGNGGDSYSLEEGGDGGNGINGDHLTITNSGTIYGSTHGSYFFGTSKDSKHGAGINGSNLIIVNSGKIIKGTGDKDAAAIRTVTGINSLTLQTGSTITGDIVLSAINEADMNTLSIVSKDATTITGNLAAKTGTDVILSGKTVTFTGDVNFNNRTSLTFGNVGGDVPMAANSIIFNNTQIKGITNIANWNQMNYTLATTKNGIFSYYKNAMQNALLTEGARDYTILEIVNDDRDLVYTLLWNDTRGYGDFAYGTFDLKEGATLTLSVALANNPALEEALGSEESSNSLGWNGKDLTKTGLGTLNLMGSNTYTGYTNINAGMLKTGVVDAFANTRAVNIASGATINLGGNSQNIGSGGSLNNAGTVLINDWDAAALTTPVTITGNVINSGLVVINNCTHCAGQTLAVDGNWTGTGGAVSFGTVLGDDNSVTDKLTITGDATGITKVKVRNENGHGARTLEGIELITTGSSTANSFEQDGRIVAGSYDYHLKKGTASGDNTNNWYLTGKLNTDMPNPGPDTYRPEAGSYANNLAAAATMFNMRLNTRQGEGYYVNGTTGELNQSNFWMRYEGNHTKNQMGGGQLDNKANRSVFQLGGDILGGSFNDKDVWRLGLNGGYGFQKTKTHNHFSEHNSNAEVNGYSVGLSGTWYQNGQDHSGLYVDSWALYSWFDNTVNGDGLRSEDYKSKGFTTSIEAGYNLLSGKVNGFGGMQNNVFIRPQGQVIWSGVHADDHTEINGTRVSGLGDGNVQTRLGLRLSLAPVGRQNSSDIQPFLETNWINNSNQYGVNMNGVKSYIEGSRNLGEVKMGLEGRFNNNFSVWGSLGHQMGSNSYSETTGIVGMKYRF